VYRYIGDEKYLPNLLRGQVRLSTLEICRGYEDVLGDKGEGEVTLLTAGPITGTGDDPEFGRLAARSGIKLPPGSGQLTIGQNTFVQRVLDAPVYCTSAVYTPEVIARFGEPCVRIERPREFFNRLTTLLAQRVGITHAFLGRVTYRSRTFRDGEDPPTFGPFIKPDDYQVEQEVRMAWQLDPKWWPPKRFTFTDSTLAGFCRRALLGP
jgi:hypothetical protein